jgi:hypothetical protein
MIREMEVRKQIGYQCPEPECDLVVTLTVAANMDVPGTVFAPIGNHNPDGSHTISVEAQMKADDALVLG